MKQKVSHKKRISVLDLMKFIAACIVMHYHCYSAWQSDGFFGDAWIVVDFFFIVTGYFTFKHFRKLEYIESDIEQKAKVSIKYVIAKMTRMLPFLGVGILIGFLASVIREPSFVTVATGLRGGILEFLMLRIALGENGIFVGAAWFLSAMLFALPLFCILCQTKRKNLLTIGLMMTFALAFLDNRLTAIQGIDAIIRAFCYMSLGVVVFELAEAIAKKYKNRVWLDVLWVVVTLLAILRLFFSTPGLTFGLVNNKILIIILYIASLSILLSGKIKASKINSGILDFLGEVSIPLFLIHQPLFGVLWFFGDTIYAAILKELAALCAAAVLVLIVRGVREHTGERLRGKA